jgi:zinc resistance-associated protein
MASQNAIKEVAMMKKTIVAATIALTLAGAGLALAQQAAPQGARGPRMSAEDMTAMTDARVASLKAGLKLTAEQEKHWPAVEAAMRERAKERADQMATRREGRQSQSQPRPDAMARLRQGADAMATRAASLKKLADAAEPLYKSLDDGQKRRFAVLLHMRGGPGGPSGHHHR